MTTEEVENALKYGRLIEHAPSVDDENQENINISEFDVYKNISPLDNAIKEMQHGSTKTSFDRKLEEIENFITEEFAENSDCENDVSKHSNRTVDIEVRSGSGESQHTSSDSDEANQVKFKNLKILIFLIKLNLTILRIRILFRRFCCL